MSEYTINNKISIIIEYVLILFLIFDFYTEYSLFVEFNATYISIALLSLVLFAKFKSKALIGRFLAIYLIIIFIPLLGANNIQTFFLKYIVIVPMSMVLDSKYQTGRHNLLDVFSNVMIVLSSVSVILWIFGPLIGWLGYIPIPDFWTHNGDSIRIVESYYFLQFNTQSYIIPVLDNIEIPRNTGIFAEAPVYNLLLCISCGYELFYKQQKSSIRQLILVVTIITTFSTTGQLYLIMAGVLYALFYTKKQLLRRILILTSPILIYIVYNLINILYIDKQTTSSYEVRQSTMNNFISMYRQNVFVGKGFGYINRNNTEEISNSIFQLLAEGGMYMFCIYAYIYVVGPFLLLLKRNHNLLCFLAPLFLVVSLTIGVYKPFELFFIGVILSCINKEKLIRKFL